MKNEIQEKLQALFVEYTKNLPAKMQKLDALKESLYTKRQHMVLEDFHREVHSLCGSAAIYGYNGLSQASRDLEIYLKKVLENNIALGEAEKVEIDSRLAKIKINAGAEASDKTVSNVVIKAPSVRVSNVVSGSSQAKKNVYLFDQDEAFIQHIQHAFEGKDYQLVILEKLHNLSQIMAAEIESTLALIINIDVVSNSDCWEFKELSKNVYKTFPLIMISDSADMSVRLKALRCGSTAFLQKPVEPFQLTKMLDEVDISVTDESYKILIIDDSESLAKYYATILEESGMEVRIVTHPLDTLNVLAEFRPDLLLLDIYMPECNGLELARVLRQQPVYTSLPIIFLSTEDDRFKQLSALSTGGDDFLTKPVQPQHLISAIRSRAKRAGILGSYMMRDSLTQLFNHTTLLQHLNLEMVRAERENTTVSFVMLDIDNFKSINDTYGHLIGDYVLKRLSDFLVYNMRRTDITGRYGGEEFGIILPKTNIEEAKSRFNELLQNFSKIIFHVHDKKFTVTFSAGIASAPPLTEVTDVVAGADKALYQAKQSGRNQVQVLK